MASEFYIEKKLWGERKAAFAQFFFIILVRVKSKDIEIYNIRNKAKAYAGDLKDCKILDLLYNFVQNHYFSYSGLLLFAGAFIQNCELKFKMAEPLGGHQRPFRVLKAPSPYTSICDHQ